MLDRGTVNYQSVSSTTVRFWQVTAIRRSFTAYCDCIL